ncbi:DsrE/DsrF/DrsH-like family protein [Chloroflexota bacterium]
MTDEQSTPEAPPAGEEKKKLTIVVYSGELDKALAAFMIAATAASMNIAVTMFFTFWGLNVIKKNDGKVKTKGFMRKMFSWLNKGGTKRLKLSKFNMMGMGTAMIKKMMKGMNMPSLDDLIGMAHQMGVKLHACSTTCGLMGLDASNFRDEVEPEIVGAAFFLGEAIESKSTLFIS